MDTFKIDSHKLIYHINRVKDWLDGKPIYPIYLEIAPAGSCNQRCVYCALDFMDYQPRFLDAQIFKERLFEMAGLGIKSIMYAGEGEPLLHRDIAEIVFCTKQAGIDCAITTNGVLLDVAIAQAILPYLVWLKISINGGTKETYAKIHRAHPDDFDKVIGNMAYAARLKRAKGYHLTLGMQLVLLPENHREVVLLAKLAKSIGMDYLVVKPYSQHPLSRTERYKNIKYGKYLYLADRLNKLNDNNFNVVFRTNTMKKWDEAKRNYRHCLTLPFWAYIDSGGSVWACSIYLTKRRFNLGNIYGQSFRQLWEGKKRISLMHWAEERLDTYRCRVNCRMDEINRYLWELKHPQAHVNFI
jgi:molybdenum cofactor biosynthesis enzyme MoaA